MHEIKIDPIYSLNACYWSFCDFDLSCSSDICEAALQLSQLHLDTLPFWYATLTFHTRISNHWIKSRPALRFFLFDKPFHLDCPINAVVTQLPFHANIKDDSHLDKII